jgi:hypothetical protein
MGIETALLVGGGLVGNYIKSQGAKKAAAAQAQGITAATDAANAYRQPYVQAGTEALGGYQSLLTPQGQADFATEYTSGPMYQMMQQQAEDATLRGASATGGLRTGQANVALSSIAPQLINQAYGQQMQGLQALMGQGYGAAEGSAGTAYQGGVAATQPQYSADTAMSNYFGDAVSTLGGVGYDAFSAPKLQPTQVYSRPGQTYGR